MNKSENFVVKLLKDPLKMHELLDCQQKYQQEKFYNTLVHIQTYFL